MINSTTILESTDFSDKTTIISLDSYPTHEQEVDLFEDETIILEF